jgi:hypothetical protein
MNLSKAQDMSALVDGGHVWNLAEVSIAPLGDFSSLTAGISTRSCEAS